MATSYELYVPPVTGPLHTMERKVARAAHKHFVKSIHERLVMLQGLVEQDGIQLDFSPESLDRLYKWFVADVRQNGHWQDENHTPDSRTLSICNDISIYLGEFLIRRAPELHWEMMLGGKTYLYYQRSVIVGFTGELSYNKKCIDFDAGLTVLANRIINENTLQESDHFRVRLKAILAGASDADLSGL